MSVDLSLIADDPELAPLWTAIYERLCSGQDPEAIATVEAPKLSAAGVATLRSWLDTTTRRRRGRSAVTVSQTGATVPVRELLKVLGLSAADLQPLVERAKGRTVVNRAAARQEASTQRQELWSYAADKLPSLPGLRAKMRTAGIGDDEQAVRRLIDALAKAMAKIPAHPPVSLPKLAHDCAGDPHYFDLDTLAGARLVAAVAEFTNQLEPSRPDRVRGLLAEVGVLADRLWATVLLYQVHVTGDGPIDRRLREATAPVALTLLDLTQNPPSLAPQVLTVVENPSVLEAAMTRNSRQALACTSGQLRGVDHTLLQLASDQGVQLQYAGDLDEHGLQIANYVATTYGAHLVAMDAATVQDAGTEPSAVPLGSLSQTCDSELAEALRGGGGRVVFQEHDVVLRRLLEPGL
ncbi:TIGR02679 domain-containing protein [Prauserella flavalba]|uniref:TIGR02679 domain-containing protein n=1 Tax=Prauserella flavalba TaxID=1477506 RepID=UPI0036E25F33